MNSTSEVLRVLPEPHIYGLHSTSNKIAQVRLREYVRPCKHWMIKGLNFGPSVDWGVI